MPVSDDAPDAGALVEPGAGVDPMAGPVSVSPDVVPVPGVAPAPGVAVGVLIPAPVPLLEFVVEPEADVSFLITSSSCCSYDASRAWI